MHVNGLMEMQHHLFKISEDKRVNRERIKGASVAVLGAARSGMALAELLTSSGAKVLLSDQKPQSEMKIPLDHLKRQGITVESGGHSSAVLNSDLICISPGIPLSVPALRQAQERRIPVLGELEVASWFCDAPMIGITGSNGKTTTTNLMGAIFKRQFRDVIVGGNIGSPLAAELQKIPGARFAILEISSFQLETIVNFHPHIAVIMNLSPNHLDRYPNYESYIEAKLRIFENMNEADILIYNDDDEFLRKRIADSRPQKIPFSNSRVLERGVYWKDDGIDVRWNNMQRRIPVTHSFLRGPHNRYNMIVAALVSVLHNVPEKTVSEVLENFPGVEHRLELAGVAGGVKFINDSKATTVASLGYALQSFTEPIVLIAGGKDKGGDFSEINGVLKRRVRAAVVLGEAAARIQDAWKDSVTVIRAVSLEEAVKISHRLANRGDVVLLSPACSSFDMFRDYEERGRQFKQLVSQLMKNSDVKAES